MNKQVAFIGTLLGVFFVFVTLMWATHPGSFTTDMGEMSRIIMVIPHKL